MKLTIAKGFEIAAEAAKISDFAKFRLGCVLLDRHRNLVGIGYNQKKTHPRQYKLSGGKKIHLHAEIHALCRNVVSGSPAPYYAIIVRLNKKGDLRKAKPCDHCQIALTEAGVVHVYHS